MEESDLKLIFNAIGSGKCLAFLGAGASCCFYNQNQEEVPGLPTGGELAKWLADQCSYNNGKSYDLPKAAEYFVYSYSGDREPLQRAIKEKIEVRCEPRPIHTVLAQLTKIKVVITSNYDILFESALNKYGRKVYKHVHDPLNPQTGRFESPSEQKEGDILFHKMHGSVDEPCTMIITESDYFQYLARANNIDRGMPYYFRNMIPQSTLLFLGYSLSDWNFRVIWEGVLSTYDTQNIRSQKTAYALVKNPIHSQIRYWSRRNVDIFDQDLTEFAIKLAGHFGLEIPQLGIEKKAEVTQP